MKTLMFSCAVMGLIITSGCGKPANQPSTTADTGVSQPGENAKRSPSRSSPAQHKVSASDLVNEYLTNSSDFTKKYTNQTVEITGSVHELSENIVGESFIRIKVTTPKGEGYILCQVPFKSAWNRVLPGQTVRLVGQYALVFSNIIRFDSCELLEVTGNPPTTVSPDELNKEFTDNWKEADEKWSKSRFVILQGVIKKVTLQNNNEFGRIEFESTNTTMKVVVEFGPTDIGDFKNLKAGRKVRLLTEYYASSSEKEVTLSLPRILSKLID